MQPYRSYLKNKNNLAYAVVRFSNKMSFFSDECSVAQANVRKTIKSAGGTLTIAQKRRSSKYKRLTFWRRTRSRGFDSGSALFCSAHPNMRTCTETRCGKIRVSR